MKIAIERTWHAIDPSGIGHALIIRVGIPLRRDVGDWAAEISLGVLEPGESHIYGVDSWQAMHLAMRFIAKSLADFETHGWRYFWVDGGDAAAAAELFISHA